MTITPDQAPREIELAMHEFQDGNLTAAVFRALNVLDVVPGHPQAIWVMTKTAERLGLRVSSDAARQYGPPAQPGLPRFLLIKAWGAGFWSDMSHVLACLLVAEISGRTPVVHWGANSHFSDGGGEAFGRFWEPVSAYTIDDVARVAPNGVYPPKWLGQDLAAEDFQKWDGAGSRLGALYLLNRPEPVAVSDFVISLVEVQPWIPPGHPMNRQPLHAIYRYLIDRYLKPRADIVQAVDRFAVEHFVGHEVVGVHVRGSDKKGECPNLDELNMAFLGYMDAEAPSVKIFLMSDDQRWIDTFAKSRHGHRIIHTDSHRTHSDIGTHFLSDTDAVALGREIMIDTYLALRCDRFLGFAYSNVSDMIRVLKPWPPGACHLLGESILANRNLFLHASFA